MADAMSRAQEIVSGERARDGRVVDLARVLSIAAQIEPELVRAMRLAVLPFADAGVEADLWFSPLVQARDPGGITLFADIAELLRRELAEPEYATVRERAADVIRDLHARHSPLLRLEESATYHSTGSTPDAYGAMERELGRAVAALETSNDATIARWAARTLPRMPALVRVSQPAIALASGAGRRLGGVRIRGVLDADAAGTSWGPELFATLPKVDVSVRLTSIGLELTHAGRESDATLNVADADRRNVVRLPHTNPLVAEISTPTPEGWEPRRIAWQPETSTTTRVELGPPIRIMNAAGDSVTFRVDTRRRMPVLLAIGMGELYGLVDTEAADLGWRVLTDATMISSVGGAAACVFGPETASEALGYEFKAVIESGTGYAISLDGVRSLADAAASGGEAVQSRVRELTRALWWPVATPAADFRRILRRGLIELDLRRTQEWIASRTRRSGMPPPPFFESPYPGLRPFEESEAPLFFGRDREVQELLARLERNRIVGLIGPAASGKTSLIQAGLIPALRGVMERDGEPLRRVHLRSAAGDVLRQLAESLVAEVFDPDGLTVSSEEIEAAIGDDPNGLLRILGRTRRSGAPQILFVVEDIDILPDRARDHLLELIVNAIRRAEGRGAIFSGRDSDIMTRAFAAVDEVVPNNVFAIPPMTRDALMEAITGPARQLGLDYEPDVPGQIVDAVSRDSSALPLLQVILRRLWTESRRQHSTRITLETLQAIGELHNTIDLLGEEAFDKLPDDEHRRIAKAIFEALAPGGRRQVARMPDLVRRAYAPIEQVRFVLEAFQTFLTVSTDRDSGGTTVELRYDIIVRDWRRLAEWAGLSPESQRSTAPSSYVYYVSYARGDADDTLRRFLDDLKDEVAFRLGVPASGVAFDDRLREFDWRRSSELRRALERSAAFVSIMSPKYFDSQYTGREWMLFRERHGNATPWFVPVLWIEGRVPAVLEQFEHIDATGRDPRVVLEVADAIIRCYHNRGPDLAATQRGPIDFESIPNPWDPPPAA